MADHRKNSFRKRPSGGGAAALIILAVIVSAVVLFMLYPDKKQKSSSSKNPSPQTKQSVSGAPLHPAADMKAPPVAPQPSTIESPTDSHAPVPPVPKHTRAAGDTAVRLAIIIDDMGTSMSEARSLAAIKVPLTFSIIPGLRSDREIAAYAADNAIETMIHVPMQSKGWPARRLEANGLLVAMDADELLQRVNGFMQRFPGAVGVNNHMGSEFTEQEEKMKVVLQALKKNDLYFIDSVTSPQSVGAVVAQRLGVRSARRNVFLDNEQDRGYILGQLAQAVGYAKKHGSAIAICHPHPVTIATLASALPDLSAQGVTLVPASQLVR